MLSGALLCCSLLIVFFLELFKVKAKVWCGLLPVAKREAGRGRGGGDRAGRAPTSSSAISAKGRVNMFNLAVK